MKPTIRDSENTMRSFGRRKMALDKGLRPVLVVAALVCTVGLWAGIASAQNPHFIDSKTRCAIEPDADFSCSFKESGLGDTETTYTFEGTANIECTCVTNSGQCPQAANKESLSQDTSTDATFDPKNGTVSATMTLTAPECPASDPPTCGRGQSFEVSSISYTGISLTDTTHGVTASTVPETAGPVEFFSCPE
jgi:hypothetical protein